MIQRNNSDVPCLFELIRIPNHTSNASNDRAPGQDPSNYIHTTQGATDNLSIITAPKDATTGASKTPPWTATRGSMIGSIGVMGILPSSSPSPVVLVPRFGRTTVALPRPHFGGQGNHLLSIVWVVAIVHRTCVWYQAIVRCIVLVGFTGCFAAAAFIAKGRSAVVDVPWSWNLW